MNETVITWSAPNFVTIGLMLIAWGLVIGIACMMYAKYTAKNDAAAASY